MARPLLLAPLAALLPALGAAQGIGVLAVADPPGPDEDLAALTAVLRPALAARAPGVLSAAELRDRIAGNAQVEPMEPLDVSYQEALALHAGGDFEGSIRALRALLTRLERHPGGDQIHSRWTRVMLRLARSEQAVGRRSEAQALLERLLRVEPGVAVDPRLYPPGFQKLVEEVRSEVKALWTRKLTVESQPGAVVYLERREMGQAPVVLELPPGRYRVSAALGSVRARDVTVDLSTDDRSVQIDLSVAEVLRPDAGPGMAIPDAVRAGRILTTAAWLGLDRAVAVRAGEEGGRRFLAATLHDVHRGTTERDGRVWLEDGTLTPALAQALAGYLLAGEASDLVTPGPALDPVLRLDGGDSPPFSPPAARTGSRALGWTAVGTGAVAVLLAGISVVQASRANKEYSDARRMLDPSHSGVKEPYTVAQYNDTIRRGDHARSIAVGTGVGAGAALLTTVITGYISYRRTGEIGPLRF